MNSCDYCAGTGRTLERVVCGACNDLNSKRHDCIACEGRGARMEEETCYRCKKPPNASNSTECFIATATYGSSFAPEVIIFRQFRDEMLIKSKVGKLFVNIYYSLSPPFAGLITKNPLLKSFILKALLTPILRLIKKLLHVQS